MRKQLMVILGCSLIISGCASMDRTEKGATIGAATGAGIGGIVGHQSGEGGKGALIGAAAGALGGGLIGHQMDKRQQTSNAQHLSIVQIGQMATEGVPSSAIIEEIRRTRSVYKLDSETIAYLKSKKVNDTVIDYMMSTGRNI